jgi:hypothetical protein
VLVLYLTGVGVGIMVCVGIIVSARIDTCIIVCAGIILDRCRRGYKIPNIQRSLSILSTNDNLTCWYGYPGQINSVPKLSGPNQQTPEPILFIPE